MELETVPAAQVKPRRSKPKPPVETQTPGATGGVLYIARKPLKIGSKKFKIGDAVPEANGWSRVESWVRAGYIDAVEV
jgi:hypothetical protein